MKIVSESVSGTINIGRVIAKRLKQGDLVFLSGGLGSGKTVLTKGIAWGLGIKKSEVTSPTFVILRQYRRVKLPLYHFDFYRVKSPNDILALGYEDYFYGQGVSVVEWPGKLGYLMPREHLKIELSLKSSRQRLLKLTAGGLRYKELLKQINEDIRH